MNKTDLRMIETMLKKQDELNSAIMKEFGLTTISKEQIDLAALDEIGEFTHELKGDWCWWKKSQERVRKLGIETYRKLLINREALKLFVDWAEECDFGYDQLPEEYEKYKTDLEEKDLGYCEGLRYIAIQEAKKALKVYENHVEMMDEKLDEWEQGERK